MFAFTLTPASTLLPNSARTQRAMPLTIAVMTYLALIAVAGALAFHGVAHGWSSALGRRLTVQIMQVDAESRSRQANAVVRALRSDASVAEAERLAEPQLRALLEPWLGTGPILDDLPIPAMVDVTLARRDQGDMARLAQIVAAAAPDARIDTHAQWLGQVSRFTRSLQLVANIILALVAGALVSIVSLGVRAGLATQRESVELLHLMGAEDDQIAREFQRLYLGHGILGAGLGALAAGATLALMLWLAPFPSASSGGGLLHFGPGAWALLLATPALVAGLVTFTARLAVRRALQGML